MTRSSYLNPKATISSVLGSDYTEPNNDEERQLGNGGIAEDIDEMYETNSTDDEYSSEESDKENSHITFSPFCEKVSRKKELPTPLFAGKNYLFCYE